jgi:hypothetical protein
MLQAEGETMIRPLLRIAYPSPLNQGQEDMLISYFQAWQRTFSSAFGRVAIPAQLTSPELAKMLKNLANGMDSMMSLDGQDGKYLFSFDDLLFNATQVPVPKEIQKKLGISNERMLEKFRDRIKRDLAGEVAKKMGISHVECADC